MSCLFRGHTLYLREMVGHAALTVNGLPGIINSGISGEGLCLLSSPMITNLSPERLHGLNWIAPSGSRARGHDYEHLKRKHEKHPVKNPATPARKGKQKKHGLEELSAQKHSSDKRYRILPQFFPNIIE